MHYFFVKQKGNDFKDTETRVSVSLLRVAVKDKRLRFLRFNWR